MITLSTFKTFLIFFISFINLFSKSILVVNTFISNIYVSVLWIVFTLWMLISILDVLAIIFNNISFESLASTMILVSYFLFIVLFQLTLINLSLISLILGQLHLWIFIPLPRDIYPIISSPGIGLQQPAMFIFILSIPSTMISFLDTTSFISWSITFSSIFSSLLFISLVIIFITWLAVYLLFPIFKYKSLVLSIFNSL